MCSGQKEKKCYFFLFIVKKFFLVLEDRTLPPRHSLKHSNFLHSKKITFVVLPDMSPTVHLRARQGEHFVTLTVRRKLIHNHSGIFCALIITKNSVLLLKRKEACDHRLLKRSIGVVLMVLPCSYSGTHRAASSVLGVC